MKPSNYEGLLSVLEDIAETAAVYGEEQQRTIGRVKYAQKFVEELLQDAQREAVQNYAKWLLKTKESGTGDEAFKNQHIVTLLHLKADPPVMITSDSHKDDKQDGGDSDE